MTEKLSYPFSLLTAFFISLQFMRKPEVPSGLTLAIEVGIKVTFENYPNQFQINLLLTSQKDAPIEFKLELVGLFEYKGTNPEADKEKIPEFLNNQGLFMLWPYMTQIAKIITADMGISPINLNLPSEFVIDPKLIEITTKQQETNQTD